MIDLSVYTMEIVIMCEIGNLGMLAYAGGGWVLQFFILHEGKGVRLRWWWVKLKCIIIMHIQIWKGGTGGAGACLSV